MSGGFSSASSCLASDGEFVCHQSQPSFTGLFLVHAGSHVRGDRRDALALGQSCSLYLPSFWHGASSPVEGASELQSHFDFDRSVLAPEVLVSRPLGASCFAATTLQSTQTAAFPSEPPRTSSPTIRQAFRLLSVSGSPTYSTFCRRKSTRVNYQAKWLTFRTWCRREGHSVSHPSIPKIVDFLLYLRKSLHLSYLSIAGYHSMLSSTFCFLLPELSSSPILHDLLRSFRLEAPSVSSRVPSWGLPGALQFLCSAPFEPLALSSFHDLTRKTLFLLAVATARRMGELQAVSHMVSFSGKDLYLSFLPEFRAKTESAANPLPRSLEDFVGDLPDELLLCPVRALRCYLHHTFSLVPRPRALFVSPTRPSHALSKNTRSYFLREVFSQASASGPVPGPSVRCRAHSICGMATLAAFLHNVSVASILAATTWRSPTVFISFYLKDLQFSYEGGFGLGPFVASGSVI